MLEIGLHQLITADPGFQAIANDRLYPVLLPDDSPYPAATFQRISTTALYCLEDRVQVTEIRLQIDTWSRTYGESRQLMEAINSVIDNFAGSLPDGTQVFGVQLSTYGDLYESAALVYRSSADFKIQFAG